MSKSLLRISSGSNGGTTDRQIRLHTPLPDLGGTTSDMTQADVVRKSESILHDILIGSAWYPFHKLLSVSAYSELVAEESKALASIESDRNCPWSDPESYEQYISPRLQGSTKSEISREPIRCKSSNTKLSSPGSVVTPPLSPTSQTTITTTTTPVSKVTDKKLPAKKKTSNSLGSLIENTIGSKNKATRAGKQRSGPSHPTPSVSSGTNSLNDSPEMLSLSERLRFGINSSHELDTHYNINDLNDSFAAIKNEMASAQCASEILGMEGVFSKLYSKISKPTIRPDLYALPLLKQRNDADKVIHIMGPPEAEIRTTVVAYSKSVGAQLFVVSGKIFIEQQLTKITRFCSDSPADVTIILLDHCEDHTEEFSNHGGTQQMAKELVFLLTSIINLPIFWVIASENPFTNIFTRLRSHILPDNCVYCLPPNLMSRQIFSRKLLEEHYPTAISPAQTPDTTNTNEELCEWISKASYLCSFSHIRDFCCMVATKKVENLDSALFEKITVDDPRLRPTLEDLISHSRTLSTSEPHIAFTKLEISPYVSVLGAVKLHLSRVTPQSRHRDGMIGKRGVHENTSVRHQPANKKTAISQEQFNIQNFARAYEDSRSFSRHPCVPPSTYAQHYQANEQQFVHE